MSSGFGAMDFSTLKKENQTSGTSQAIAGEVQVAEDNFEVLVTGSQSKAVFLLLTSARVNGGAAFIDDVRAALARYTGTFTLAIVDADQQPRVAAMLRPQTLPTALLILKGQAQPLFEGVVGSEQLEPLLAELATIAEREGLETAPPQDLDQQAVPEELEAAYSAMEGGDFSVAREQFLAFAQKRPGDAEAKKGIAMVDLLQRTQGADLHAGREAAAANPADVDAQLHAADLDLLGGHVDDAFSRLLTVFRDGDAQRKDEVRARLIELFDVVGPEDPRVSAARKRLSRMLF